MRKGSLFERWRSSLQQIVVAMYEWSRMSSVDSVCKDTGLGRDTVLMIGSFLRKITFTALAEARNCKIGGPETIVEIDETMIARRKYNVGRAVGQQWLFGGVVRGSGGRQLFLELVPDRSRATLEEVLARRVEIGTIVYSDEWSSYSHISGLGFEHHTVNHSRNLILMIRGFTHRASSQYGVR